MSLNQFSSSLQSAWSFAGSAVGPFAGPSEQSSLQWTLTGLSTTTWNQLYATQFTIAASGTHTVTLTGLTNLVNESFSFAKVLLMQVTVTGGNITVGPGGTNGLLWFFDDITASIKVMAGGAFYWSDVASGSGQTVDATHKTLDFINLDAINAAVVTLMVIGHT